MDLERIGIRAHYDPAIPSVTELLRFAGYFDGYPEDTTGFYRRRGHFVDQCCAIIAQGKHLTANTMAVGSEIREKPLTRNGENKEELWNDYIAAFENWMLRYGKVKFIAAQEYVQNPFEHYQGTYDLLVAIDGRETLIDIKTGSCPKSTALQTAGYVMCLNKRPLCRLGLELRDDQTFKEHPYRDFGDYDRFRLLARYYHAHGPKSEYR